MVESEPAGGTPQAPAPLGGHLVVDLSRLLPGPLTARLLADLGARVIKVEEPGLGDPVRQAPPFKGGKSALATLLLTAVESIALDLKKAPAREVLEALLERADVLLATFRPGTLARLGLAPEALRRRYPRLVVCSLTGWGEDGPYARRAGHDLTYQAVAGSLAPTAAVPALPVADLTGAWSAVTAILAALVARQTSGEGAVIDASLYDAALHANLTNWAAEAAGPRGVGEALPLTGALPCYALYRTADGAHLALAALEGKFWRRFCRAVGRRDLSKKAYSSDPRVHREVARLIGRRRGEEWQALLEAEDIPGEVVLSAAEAAAHPQARARGVLLADGDGGARLAFPARFDGARPRAAGGFPALGEHTDALLAEWGLAPAGQGRRGGKGAGRRSDGIGRRFSAQRLLWRLVAALRPGGV